MEAVARLVASDESIKGLWIVPKYGNPTGVTLSASVVSGLARMKTAAPDFRIMWDNAYAVHDLNDTPDVLANGLAEAEIAGQDNRLWLYASFSKVTFAGASVAAMASSVANIARMRKHRANVTIGPDKLNQLRHVRFLKSVQGVRDHMRKHAAILRPKFELVQRPARAWGDRSRGGFAHEDTSSARHAGPGGRVVKGRRCRVADSGRVGLPAREGPVRSHIRLAPSPRSPSSSAMVSLRLECASAE
jgi:hypothetical protein